MIADLCSGDRGERGAVRTQCETKGVRVGVTVNGYRVETCSCVNGIATGTRSQRNCITIAVAKGDCVVAGGIRSD